MTNSKRYPFFLYVCFIVSVLVSFLAAPGRALAADIVVTSRDDTAIAGDGLCTLREAIIAANNDANFNDCIGSGSFGADTITFLDFLFDAGNTLELGSTLPIITDADNLTIDGESDIHTLFGVSKTNGNISGGGTMRVMILGSGASLTLQNIGISRGFAADGGGIVNRGTLTIINGTFLANRADNSGGGIANGGTLTVTNSLFSFNSAVGVDGGGIVNSRMLTITKSTFEFNEASLGGGISNSGTLKITNSTLVGNKAAVSGGGITNFGAATLRGTIMANSASGGNCFNAAGTLTDGGFNIDDDGTCSLSAANNSLPNTNPLLDPAGLKFNGGRNQTISLQSTSPAIDAISSAACTDADGSPLTEDQRGSPRPLDGLDEDSIAGCDIGAYESNEPIIVNTTEDELNSDGDCSLREAIFGSDACKPRAPGPETILFSVTGTITLGSTLPIGGELAIVGPAGGIVISGNNSVRIMNTSRSASLTLANLTITDGFGSAILNGAGDLTVINSTFSNNSGGCIFNSSFIDKFGPFGTRIARLTIVNSTFTGNTSTTDGGCIYNIGDVTIINSTFTDNNATNNGGAIFNLGVLIAGQSEFVIINSTFSNNSASNGGAIYNESELTLFNTIVANSPSGGNCAGFLQGIMNGGFFNIDDDGTCRVGIVADPMLDPAGLQNNGGPTQTIALLPGSPAIDAIANGRNGCGKVLNTDQRGLLRPADGDGNGSASCDIGAFEVQPAVFNDTCAGRAPTMGCTVNGAPNQLCQGHDGQRYNYRHLRQ